MTSELISDAPIINNFTDEMYCWILDPNSSPQTNRFLLSNLIQEQRLTYAVNVGSANAIELVLKSPLTSYVEGLVLYFKTPDVNTGAVTVKSDALAAIDVVNRDGTPLAAGVLPAGSLNIVQYDGANFQLMSSTVASAWVASLTTGDVSAIQNTVISDITAQTGTKTFTGLDWTIDVTGRTSTGEVNFLNFKKTDTGTTSVFKVDIDGNLTIAADTDASTVLGRARINSRGSDIAYFSHFDQSGLNDYSIRQTAGGQTSVNSSAGQVLLFQIGGVNAWSIDSTGALVGVAGKEVSVEGKIFANDRIALGLTTGDVASPLEGEFWYNFTTHKYRGNQGGGAIDIVGGGSSVGANNEIQTSDGSGAFVASKLFFDEATGNMTLGDSGLAGTSRTFTTAGSETSVGMDFVNKGATGSYTFTTASAGLFSFTIGSTTSEVAATLSVLANKNVPNSITLQNIGTGGTKLSINTTNSVGDPSLEFGAPSNFYSFGIDNSVGDVFKIQHNSSASTPSTAGTILMQFSGTGIGFYNTTPIAQPIHIADATDAASAITQLNLLLAKDAALGLQASS
jgi:hypothetical protein